MTIYRNLLIAVFLGFCLMANGQQSVSQQTEEFLLYDKTDEILAEEHVYDQGGNMDLGVPHPLKTGSINAFTG